MKEPLIILTGPTAVGKTHLSIALAKAVDGRDHFGGFHAGLQTYGYRFGKDYAGGDGRSPSSSGGCSWSRLKNFMWSRFQEMAKCCHEGDSKPRAYSDSGGRNRILYSGSGAGY